jgi:hypothetical protein
MVHVRTRAIAKTQRYHWYMCIAIPWYNWYMCTHHGTIYHKWYTCTYHGTETVLREAMQALVRVQAHMLARIVVEIRAADNIAVELEPQL